MLDPDLQQRFTRGCTDAAFGYSAASTAAYAAFADQVMNFWSGVLQPPRREPEIWRWPVPMAPTPALAPFAMPFAWALPQAPVPAPLPANPWEAMTAFASAMSSALGAMSAPAPKSLANPFAMPVTNPMANPMSAWLAMFPFASPPSAWPMAFMMMSSGVPHAVAWPTAKANAAVLDAAGAATQSIRKVFASYQTEGGHAASPGTWPHADMLTLMTMVPLNVGTMFTALRMS
jgi:hypothetical protein